MLTTKSFPLRDMSTDPTRTRFEVASRSTVYGELGRDKLRAGHGSVGAVVRGRRLRSVKELKVVGSALTTAATCKQQIATTWILTIVVIAEESLKNPRFKIPESVS